MYFALSVSLAASVVLGMSAGPLSRRLPPAQTVRLLSVAALFVSLATGFSLSAVAFTQLAQIPLLAAAGNWSAAVLNQTNPMPALVGPPAAAAVVLLAAAALRRGARAGRDLWAAQRACRELGGDDTGLVVVDDARADAYALPGLTGRVVVSTAMLRALPAPERRVLLAHEASHLRHRHHVYVLAVELGAAANPVLRRLAAIVRTEVERWADEDAASCVGDRRLTARALARAALARDTPLVAGVHGSPGVGGASAPPGVVLRMSESVVVGRVRALLAPPPRTRHRPETLVVAAVLVAIGAANVEAGQDTETLFEHAQAVYQVHR